MADTDSEVEVSQLDVSSSSNVKQETRGNSPKDPLHPDDFNKSEPSQSSASSQSHTTRAQPDIDHSLPTSSSGMADSFQGYQDNYHSDKEGSLTSSPVKKYKKFKHEKYCLVCGDRALGYNFNAVTCESCKAFFRRNALKDQSLKCLFQGNCSIDVRTRRFCPYCRLNKCNQIGMKREMILDENERKARMNKVSINRARKQCGQKNDPMDNVVIKDEPMSDPEPEASNHEAEARGMGEESPLLVSGSGAAPVLIPNETLDVIINRSMLPSDPLLYRTLTPNEKKLISDVTMAYKETLASYAVEQHVNQEENYSNLNDIVNNSEVAVRRLIKFVKLLSDFKILSQENQIAALKACVLNTLLLRSVNFYDVENDAWRTPTGSIPTNVLKQATGHHQLHEDHTSYCRSLKAISQDDVYIMAILQVMIIFRPDGVNLEHRHEVSDLQDKYILLLKHYLESSFSYMHAHIVFSNLLRKFNELQKIGDDHAKIVLQVNASQIEPLMLEVLNLH
ncbi:nuclear hormone receptor HR96-like isoform X1 [Mizuhopecten yessoensis]|uniref:nuclear hormone receptor HR96-like isoform X1 n=1 Tax=Mizuhopecten yessoensis TaxID=6573 RepID=UPI000B45C2E2|nr:nuclear hormone receptor HR96-like isoform X1 [Mizuhopecten yessoensis]